MRSTRPPRLRRRDAGFTLLEIIVVMVILGLLATFVVQNVFGHVDQARLTKARSDVQTLSQALEVYNLDNHRYPSTEQGLDALVKRPTGATEARTWREGGYISALPLDPWGNPYQYLQPGKHGRFDVFSLGKDGKLGGEGEDADIGNWDPSAR